MFSLYLHSRRLVELKSTVSPSGRSRRGFFCSPKLHICWGNALSYVFSDFSNNLSNEWNSKVGAIFIPWAGGVFWRGGEENPLIS